MSQVTLPSLAAATAAWRSQSQDTRYRSYVDWLAELQPGYPAAFLDLNALRLNAAQLVERAKGLPIRVASKSVRSTELLRAVLKLDGFAGVLGFSITEALHLVKAGVTSDVLVAYPVLDPTQLRALLADPAALAAVTLTVDRPEQLTLLAEAHAEHTAQHGATPELRLCLDFDCSLRCGPVHLGARRSAIRTPKQAAAAAAAIAATPGVRLVAMLGYEAQVAGVTDTGPAISAVKHASVHDLAARRQAAVTAVTQHTQLEFVNGGGTGSFETTRLERGITELAAGSGLFAPHLFDGYRSFQPHPAAFFALQITRNPTPGFATVHGGGWIASGVVGKDRQPQPVWPRGMRLTALEGAGEVQTPVRCRGTVPRPGDVTLWRHTKAGELCEHVNELLLYGTPETNSGTAPATTALTYRGEGKAFL